MSVSGLLLSCSTKNGEEGSVPKKGIVSILGGGSDVAKEKCSSLRRTLSADMSSKKWLAQNGMKKMASSQHLALTTIDSSSSSSSEDEDDDENPRQSDIWSKIMSQKVATSDGGPPPPYVHSLVRRSSSSLSEKSLKICTESLGSETGSDVVFLSYQPLSSEAAADAAADDVAATNEEGEEEKNLECQVVKYNYDSKKTSFKKASSPTTTRRSFPPPLASLARGDGSVPTLHMHSRRQNGRLVLEAVTTIPSQNFFQAHRQNGRLLLTLVNKNPVNQLIQSKEEYIEEEEIDHDNVEEDEEEEEEMFETNYSQRSVPKLINVHRSAKMLKKQIEIANKVVSACEITKNPQSLPPPPPPAALSVVHAAATSFNSYEYFWRAKPTVASVINIPITNSTGPLQNSVTLKDNYSNKGYMQKDLVLLRGNKADCLLPLLTGCKKPRRSLLFWEPPCIATS